MNESLLFQNARKLTDKLSYNDLSNDLKVIDSVLKIIGKSTLIEEPSKSETPDVYNCRPSPLLIFITSYLKGKYSDIVICLARFNKIIELLYNIKYIEMDQKVFADLCSYIFIQQFNRIKN